MAVIRLLLVACLAWNLAVGQTTPVKPGSDIAWRSDYAAALKEAAAAKKPLFIAFVMDGEPANEVVLAEHFHDPDIIAASGEYVCLLANMSRHPEVERQARESFMNSPRVAAPQFLFVRPDGESVILRHVWTLPAPELLKKMRRALALLDPAKAGDADAVDRKLVDGWIAGANSNNAVKRSAALVDLANTDDPRVIEFFVKQTAESVDEMKRLEAINAMASRPANGAVLPTLHKLLHSQSQRVKIRAASALEKIAAPESGAALASALKRETKDRVRAALLRALAVCDGVTPAHRKLLVAAAKASGQTERTAALRAMADLPQDNETTAAVVAGLKDASNAVRAVAYFSAAKSEDAALAPMVKKAAAGEKSTHLLSLSKLAVQALTGGGFDAEAMKSLIGPYLSSYSDA